MRRKAGAASGRSCPERRNVIRARSTAVAVPPGKRNGWEHQDLRRRHLLVREIGNSPRRPNSAMPRPLRKHSATGGRFHQSIWALLSPGTPWGEASTIGAIGPRLKHMRRSTAGKTARCFCGTNASTRSRAIRATALHGHNFERGWGVPN
jgi:hypothetical protein